MQGEVFGFKVCRLAAFLRVSGFRVVVAEEIFLGSEVMDKQPEKIFNTHGENRNSNRGRTEINRRSAF